MSRRQLTIGCAIVALGLFVALVAGVDWWDGNVIMEGRETSKLAQIGLLDFRGCDTKGLAACVDRSHFDHASTAFAISGAAVFVLSLMHLLLMPALAITVLMRARARRPLASLAYATSATQAVASLVFIANKPALYAVPLGLGVWLGFLALGAAAVAAWLASAPSATTPTRAPVRYPPPGAVPPTTSGYPTPYGGPPSPHGFPPPMPLVAATNAGAETLLPPVPHIDAFGPPTMPGPPTGDARQARAAAPEATADPAPVPDIEDDRLNETQMPVQAEPPPFPAGAALAGSKLPGPNMFLGGVAMSSSPVPPRSSPLPASNEDDPTLPPHLKIKPVAARPRPTAPPSNVVVAAPPPPPTLPSPAPTPAATPPDDADTVAFERTDLEPEPEPEAEPTATTPAPPAGQPSPACPQCDAPMAWNDQYLRFFCPACRVYF